MWKDDKTMFSDWYIEKCMIQQWIWQSTFCRQRAPWPGAPRDGDHNAPAARRGQRARLPRQALEDGGQPGHRPPNLLDGGRTLIPYPERGGVRLTVAALLLQALHHGVLRAAVEHVRVPQGAQRRLRGLKGERDETEFAHPFFLRSQHSLYIHFMWVDWFIHICL